MSHRSVSHIFKSNQWNPGSPGGKSSGQVAGRARRPPPPARPRSSHHKVGQSLPRRRPRMDLLSSTGSSATQGMAYVGAMCRGGESSSLVEDVGGMAPPSSPPTNWHTGYCFILEALTEATSAGALSLHEGGVGGVVAERRLGAAVEGSVRAGCRASGRERTHWSPMSRMWSWSLLWWSRRWRPWRDRMWHSSSCS